MTDTSVSDAVVFPQDRGTKAPDEKSDRISGGYLAMLSRYRGDESYVGENSSGNPTLQFIVDSVNNTVDIEPGYAYISVSNVEVQGGSESGFDTTLPIDIPTVVALPSTVSGLSLGDNTTNDLWLAFDPTTNDSVYIRHGSSVSEPSDPSVKLGVVDTTDESTKRPNDLSTSTFEETISNLVTTGRIDGSDYNETVISGLVSGTTGLDCSSANFFRHTLAGDTTFQFENPESDPAGNSFTIIVIQDSTGGHSVSWPSSVEWDSGTSPSLSTNAGDKHMLSFLSSDGGQTWIGLVSAEAIA